MEQTERSETSRMEQTERSETSRMEQTERSETSRMNKEFIPSSFYSHLPAYEDGTDRVFRNVGT